MFKKKQESRQNLRTRKDELITITNPKSPVAEAFRSIRTNLTFLSPDNPLHTILVTSSLASEGKSLILANLAVSLAQNGKKVIVIDADLRKPMQHKFFEMLNLEGLSSILTDDIPWEEGLRQTMVDGLELISTGIIPPNPAELLASHKLEEVLMRSRKEADIVLIDTPPVIAVTDASVLATKVDGVLLVVASHQTEKDALVKAHQTLRQVKANIIGTVLNKYPVDKAGGYNQYYYYYGQDLSN